MMLSSPTSAHTLTREPLPGLTLEDILVAMRLKCRHVQSVAARSNRNGISLGMDERSHDWRTNGHPLRSIVAYTMLLAWHMCLFTLLK